MLVFLELNGYRMEYTQKELSDLILDVAADRKLQIPHERRSHSASDGVIIPQ